MHSACSPPQSRRSCLGDEVARACLGPRFPWLAESRTGAPARIGTRISRSPFRNSDLARTPSADPAAKEALLICRIWHGWTTTENSRRYEEIVRGEVIPAIEDRHMPGFLSIDLVRRPVPEGHEFVTIMWFDDIDSVKAFVGEDYEVAHVPERAREVLSHFDARSTHFEVLDRREQFP